MMPEVAGSVVEAASVVEWATPDWGIVGVVLLLAASLLLALRRSNGTGRGVELLWLLPALLALGWAAAGPVKVQEGSRQEPARFAVLVDDSRSLQVTEEGRPRSQQAEEILARLKREERAEIFVFGSGFEASGVPGFQQGDTDLAGALQGLRERFTGEQLAGIALVTDGIDRGSLRTAWRETGLLDLPDLPGPLTVYAVGSETGVKDVSVLDVEAGGFAFLRAPFEIRARIQGRSYGGKEVPVRLLRDGLLVAEKTVLLDAEGEASVVFSQTPRKVGRFSYEVEIPLLEGDAVEGNNRMPVAIRVVRDRLRVLQVCGSPSLDQKFLRLFLKQDPSVDLVSFFILRTDEDMSAGYRTSELSLIAFPYERLFSEDLWSFDLVLLQNFNYEPYFGWRSSELLGNLAEYVRRGGALVMIGGDRSFDEGAYAATPLAEVLPVRLGVAGERTNTASFRARLSPQGRLHPLTQLLPNRQESEAMWGRLAGLDGLNLTRGLAPGSASLLVHPTLETATGEPMPVLAVREVGAGRTLALMGDSSWRWVMAEAAAGHGNQAYLRFWKSAMRWLVHDPSGEPVQVDTTRENHLLGEEARIRIRVRNVGFEPVEGAEVTGRIVGPAGVEEFEAVADESGEVLLQREAVLLGTHHVEVQARKDGVRLGEARTVYAVTARDPELEEVAADTTFLKALAEAAEGRFVGDGSWAAPLRDEDAGRWVTDRKETPLWSAWWVPLVAGLFGSVSWWARRRGGGR
jgi:uncharacterized membrane protein